MNKNYIKLKDLTQQKINQKLLKPAKSQSISFASSHQLPASISGQFFPFPLYPLDNIWINMDCQRDIDSKRARKIQKIANEFNPNAFNVPTATLTDDGEVVIPDGMGRCIAAVLANVKEVPLRFCPKDNPEQSDNDWQGEHFLTQDENVQAIDGWQTHRVALKIENPSKKGTKTQVARARDIQRVLDKLNNSGNGTFGFDGESLDFCNAYRYFTNGIIRDSMNSDAKQDNAGKRDAPELYEACLVYKNYVSDQKVEGQNLEVFNYFIIEFAKSYARNTGTTYSLIAIKEASKKLRFILQINGNGKKLSNSQLKSFLQTENAANDAVRENGLKKLTSEWNKICNDVNLMRSYQQFV